jgi:hypothetical protein
MNASLTTSTARDVERVDNAPAKSGRSSTITPLKLPQPSAAFLAI